MKTLGVTVYFDGSALVRNTVTPPAGAGVDKLTGSSTDWVIPTAWKTGRRIAGVLTTVMLAAVAGKAGRALAWITAEPGATLVTPTFAVVVLAGKVTVGDTVATLVLLELRLTVRPPAGAGVDRFSVRL